MKDRPVFSLLHPTARVKPYPSFPQGWRHACQAWFDACGRPQDVEYVISVHASRWEEFYASEFGPIRMDMPNWGAIRIVKNEGRDSVVDQLNCAAAASDGRILAGVMDDYFPPRRWDVALLNAFPSLDEAWLINCATGGGFERDRALMIGGVWTRELYRRFGFVLPPQFESMYSDNFMADRHRAGGYVVERFDIVFDHRHPSFGKGETDEIYALQNRPEAYAKGYQLLNGGKAAGDGRSLALVMPGERFASVWVTYWSALIAHALERGFRLFSPPFAAYSSNVYETRTELHEALLEVQPAPDFVLWLDDDNVLCPWQFDRLVSDLDADSSLDMVAGWTFCGTDAYMNEYRTSAGWDNLDGSLRLLEPGDTAEGKVVSVDWTGFPAVLMRGSTLRKAGPSPFAPMFDRSGSWDRLMGEDRAFSVRLKARGGRIAVDSEVLVPHFKLRSDAPAEVLEQVRARDAREIFEMAADGPGKVVVK